MLRIRNPVLVLALGIPLLAVIASFLTLFLAIAKPDGELPEQYHWEGFKLDRDFEQSKRAAALNVRATVTRTQAGICRLELSVKDTPPAALTLVLTHATQPGHDRTLNLTRASLKHEGASYEAPCVPVPNAHWRVSLSDDQGAWSLRQYTVGALNNWTLTARADMD
jgi:hypothetical protein